ncbi:MAG: hypothetical protein JXB50_12060 [Spirochaetes bacterium]|nr:hypothetical protein [Spirochaetota bacterium]
MKVLLSIKPEFAFKIFEGDKKYEYRRTIFKKKDIEKIIVYASSPIKKVIGEFYIDDLLFDDINTLWLKTEKFSGITKEYFFDYFMNKNHGYAIKIKNTKLYNNPLNLIKNFGVLPPQSFVYL